MPPEELEELAREEEVWVSLLRLLPPMPLKDINDINAKISVC